jgi:predicted aspartyl protease
MRWQRIVLGGLVAGMVVVGIEARAVSAWTVEEILARHAAAQGGVERLSTFRTFHALGRIQLSGFPIAGTVETWYARPCDLRQAIDLGVYRMTAGCDDGIPWVLDANGQITANRDSATIASTALACVTQGFDYLRPGAVSAELRGAEAAPNPSDPPRLVLHLREPHGGELDLLLDPRTWLIVESRGTEQGHPVIGSYSDYRTVQGVPVAFAVEQRVPTVGQTMVITLETAAFDEPLPDTLFTLPRAPLRDFAFPGGSGAVTAPVLYAENLLFIAVSVAGGAPVNFVIDSGAGTTVLDSAYAVRLGVHGTASLPGMGGGGVRRAELATLPPLEVVGLRLESQTGAILPLTEMVEAATGVPAAGILGFDFLSRFVTRIAYADRTVTFWDPDTFATRYRAFGSTVEAPLVMNLFSLPATVDQGCSGTILLDTGAAHSLLGRAFAERCGALERTGVTSAATGIAGEERSRTVRLDSLRVAGFTVVRPTVGLQIESGGGFLAGPYAGLLGNDVLERFALTLDYRHQRVTFEPGPYFDRPRPPDRSGLVLARDAGGRVLVHGLIGDSPAARAGMREGDEIRTIDGDPVDAVGPLHDVRERLRGEAGEAVRIGFVRDGKTQEVRFKLADYF